MYKISAYTVKESLAFVEKLYKLSPTDRLMVSYDIKSLFTTVLLTEINKICLRDLYHSKIQCPSILESVLLEMMSIATFEEECSFMD